MIKRLSCNRYNHVITTTGGTASFGLQVAITSFFRLAFPVFKQPAIAAPGEDLIPDSEIGIRRLFLRVPVLRVGKRVHPETDAGGDGEEGDGAPFVHLGWGWKKEKGSVCLVCLSGGHGCEIVFQSREVVRPARACVIDVAPHHTAVSHRECCATCRGLRSPRVRERRRRRRVPRTTRSRSAATRPRGGSTHFALKISISPRPHEDGGGRTDLLLNAAAGHAAARHPCGGLRRPASQGQERGASGHRADARDANVSLTRCGELLANPASGF